MVKRYMRPDIDGSRCDYTLSMLRAGGNNFTILYLQIMDSNVYNYVQYAR